jgi:TonB family protein
LLLGDSDTVAARDTVYFAFESGPQSLVSEGTIKETSATLLGISTRTTSRTKGGAPLFNREGEVIGILIQSIEGRNQLYAIPVSFLKTLLQYRNGGPSAGARGSGVPIRTASGDPGADRPVGFGPDQGSGASGGSPQPEGTSLHAASVDTKPVGLNNVQPRYTEEARRNKTQGFVNVVILIGEDGEVKQARITKGLPDGLNEQALAAAHQIRFKPATRNGKAVSYWMPIAVEFNLR